MVNEDAQMVLAGNKGIGDIEGVAGPSHKLSGVGVSVERNGSVGAYTLKLKKI